MGTVLPEQIAIKIQQTQDISISYSAIWQHFKKREYQSSVPRGTLMLTEQHIEARKLWV